VFNPGVNVNSQGSKFPPGAKFTPRGELLMKKPVGQVSSKTPTLLSVIKMFSNWFNLRDHQRQNFILIPNLRPTFLSFCLDNIWSRSYKTMASVNLGIVAEVFSQITKRLSLSVTQLLFRKMLIPTTFTYSWRWGVGIFIVLVPGRFRESHFTSPRVANFPVDLHWSVSENTAAPWLTYPTL
jgi:hypothetical protein